MKKLLFELYKIWRVRRNKILIYILFALSLSYSRFTLSILLLTLTPLVIRYVLTKPNDASYSSLFRRKDILYFITSIILTIVAFTLDDLVYSRLYELKKETANNFQSLSFSNCDLLLNFKQKTYPDNTSVSANNEYLYLHFRNGRFQSSETNEEDFGYINDMNIDFTLRELIDFDLTVVDETNKYYFLELIFKSSESVLTSAFKARLGTTHCVFNLLIPTDIKVCDVEPSNHFLKNVYLLLTFKNYKTFNSNCKDFTESCELYSDYGIHKIFSDENNRRVNGQRVQYHFDIVIKPFIPTYSNEPVKPVEPVIEMNDTISSDSADAPCLL